MDECSSHEPELHTKGIPVRNDDVASNQSSEAIEGSSLTADKVKRAPERPNTGVKVLFRSGEDERHDSIVLASRNMLSIGAENRNNLNTETEETAEHKRLFIEAV